jgi:hypothetical protein
MENNDISEYIKLLERVESIISKKGYKIESEQIEGGYIFNIKDNDIIASNITIYKSTGTITVGKTRQSQELPIDVFHITWIATENEYRGQGLALLLLIYSICYLKGSFPDVNYVTLDDDSDRSALLIKNVYDSLGFGFQGLIELDMSKNRGLIIPGPEKQLLLDEKFIINANAQLDSITKKRSRDDVQQSEAQQSEAQQPVEEGNRLRVSAKRPNVGGKRRKITKKRNKRNKTNKKNKKTKRRKIN